MNLSEITFIVLAGGVGKRFVPFETDKTLVPLFGKPLLQHSLEQIQRVGGKKVVVVSNSKNEEFLAGLSCAGLQIQTIQQPQALGMGAAVLQAQNIVQTNSAIVMNAIDQVEDSLFLQLFEKINQHDVLVTGKKQSEYFPGGYLKVEGDRVVAIVEKPPQGEQPSDMVNLVFHYFKNLSAFSQLVSTTHFQTDDQYEQALHKLMDQEAVGFIPYSGYWQAIKQPHMILSALEFHLQHSLSVNSSESQPQRSDVIISPQAIVEGPVQFGLGVKIEAGATIKGPCYIGDHCLIGNGSLVRSSTIEANSIVGFGSEVVRSYVGPGSMLHHNFIGDSIIEGNCNPSWGTCFANWRMDHQSVTISYPNQKVDSGREKFGSIVGAGSFFGVNCSLMPGTTIAPHSQVYPNLCVKGHASGTIKKSNL